MTPETIPDAPGEVPKKRGPKPLAPRIKALEGENAALKERLAVLEMGVSPTVTVAGNGEDPMIGPRAFIGTVYGGLIGAEGPRAAAEATLNSVENNIVGFYQSMVRSAKRLETGMAQPGWPNINHNELTRLIAVHRKELIDGS